MSDGPVTLRTGATGGGPGPAPVGEPRAEVRLLFPTPCATFELKGMEATSSPFWRPAQWPPRQSFLERVSAVSL